MNFARIVVGLVFGLLSAFIVGYSVIEHDHLSDDEMMGFAYLSFFAAGVSGLFLFL